MKDLRLDQKNQYAVIPSTSEMKTPGQFRFWNGTTGNPERSAQRKDNTTGQSEHKPFQASWVKAEAASPVSSAQPKIPKPRVADHLLTGVEPTTMKSSWLKPQTCTPRTFLMFTDEGLPVLGCSRMAYRGLAVAGPAPSLDVDTVSRDGERLAINNLPNRFARTPETPLIHRRKDEPRNRWKAG